MPQNERHTYLITGGAGFIGSHMVDELLARGHHVRVIDNFSTGKRENLAHVRERITLYERSITERAALDAAMAGVDYVLHLAALASVPRSVADPLSSNEHNVTGTLNVLLAARDAGVRRVVYAGSSSAYGNVDAPRKSEDLCPQPLSPYAVAKLTGEQYCRVFTHVYGLETVVVRYFNVFGPRQDPSSPYSAVIPKFIAAMLRGQSPTVEGDGLQSRDFTYVANVVQGTLLACHAPNVAGEVFNIALGGQITLLEMIASLNELLGTQIAPTFVAPRPGDVRHSRADIRKARERLSYTPQVDFREGLARTLAWYREAMTE